MATPPKSALRLVRRTAFTAWKMALQPCEILLRSRRVYDQQKFLLANSINNQVINDATTLVQQKRVLPGSNIELADVICQHGVKPFARACPIDRSIVPCAKYRRCRHCFARLDVPRRCSGIEPALAIRRKEPFSRRAGHVHRKVAFSLAQLRSRAKLDGTNSSASVAMIQNRLDSTSHLKTLLVEKEYAEGARLFHGGEASIASPLR